MRSYERRGLSLEQAQKELKERLQKRKVDKKRFAKQGKRRILFPQTPEARCAARHALITARNKALADEKNQTFFSLLSLTRPSEQMAALRLRDTFIPLIVNRLVDEGFLSHEQSGIAIQAF